MSNKENNKIIVPVHFHDFDYFDQQRSCFDEVKDHFNNDRKEFNNQLEVVRSRMFDFNDGQLQLNVDQPYVEDVHGNKKFKLQFNCHGIKPEDIEITTKDNNLTVHAKHMEFFPGRTVRREFTKTYTLPSVVDPILLRSVLSKDGMLAIEAPVSKEVAAKKEVLVPLEILIQNK